MFQRIFTLIGLLLIVAVSSVLTAPLYSTCKCLVKPLKCPKLSCPQGSLAVDHPCLDCCRICGKTLGEECGGKDDVYGRCSPNLKCQPGLFTSSNRGNHKGTCIKPFGFYMNTDFLQSDEQKNVWDDWDSFKSPKPKKLHNGIDVSNDYLKPENMKQKLWDEGWDFSFSSYRQSSSIASESESFLSDKPSNNDKRESGADSDSDSDSGSFSKSSEDSKEIKPKPNELLTNEIMDKWLFSFSSGGSGWSIYEIEGTKSQSSDGEGSGDVFNNKLANSPPA